jgi:uncharacterized protein YqeY
MELYKSIELDVKIALKSGDALKVSVLRMVVSAVKSMMIEKNLKSVTDGDVCQILQKQVKQHKESIAQFEKGARPDLVKKEADELKVLEAYQPKQLSEAEVMALIKEVIAETGASSKSDTGRVMKAVMEKAKGRSDGKTINQLLAGLLK